MQRLILALLIIYRRFISPLYPPCCRFYPSCSEYAYTAIKNKGAMKGILYSLTRIVRCHPLNPGGYDPVNPVPHAKAQGFEENIPTQTLHLRFKERSFTGNGVK